MARSSAARSRNRRSRASRPERARLREVPGLGDESADLDRLIHERMRLGIVSALAVNEALSFNDLKKLVKATDGNLSVHARRLEDAGYVECTKSFVGRVPHTEYRLTDSGRKALHEYLDHMENLIRATRS